MKRVLMCFILLLIPFSYSLAANKTQYDADYMQVALNLAKQHPKEPFAAVIVNNGTGKIMCTGVNAVREKHNPTLHGEIVTINNCSKKYPNMDWKNSTLYTTAEPCPMCQGAIIWAGIPRMVYGTSIEGLEERNWDAIKVKAKKLNTYADFYKGSVTGGVLSNLTNPLFDQG